MFCAKWHRAAKTQTATFPKVQQSQNSEPPITVVYVCPSLKQAKEPMSFEIWQPSVWLQYISCLNRVFEVSGSVCHSFWASQTCLPLLLTVRHSDLHLIQLFSRQENELTWHTAQQSTKGQQEKITHISPLWVV